MSNLFELLVVSSEDKRFMEWMKCFELLFNVTSDQIMTDYNQLFTLINVTTNTYVYNNEPSDSDYPYCNDCDPSDYDWIILLPNRNWF